MSVIEIVRYRLKTEATPDQAVAAWEKSQSFAKAQPGFIGRRIATTIDGEWIDEVEWESLEDAHAAASAFNPETYPELMDLLAVLDQSSMSMTHYTVQGSTA
ncbi:antibiotic biosynthesis monooxygenase family protein [Shimia sp. MIT1388]|uniref:antibiotic biosynthesis monooxygenase family protein n=1 Tax=Shimia sp. MIT1388 TaxID=3096992 RepID=UPI00399B289B